MAVKNDQSTDFTHGNKENIVDNNVDNGSGNVDAEKGTKSQFGQSAGNKNVGSRIAPVLPHLQGYDFGSDDSGSDILGKQIEMEADNAIQYRTCSWQKVSPFLAL